MQWTSPPIHRALTLPLALALALGACGGDDGGGGSGTAGTGETDGGGGTSGGGTSGTSGGSAGTSGTTGSGGTSGGTSGTTGSGGTTGGEADVPTDIPYCAAVAQWDPQWAAMEEEILAIVNQNRAQGANCGSEGSFAPAAPLVMNPNLRCSARNHSKDMAERNYFDHVNPDGEDPFDRMMRAGYDGFTMGENIAAGNATAAATMDQWMNSDGHCANIMNPDYTELGVGYSPGGQYGHLWTQNFGG